MKIHTRKRYLGAMDKIGLAQTALKPLPRVIAEVRARFNQFRSNKKARLLYEEFRPLVFGLKDCFDDMNGHSFSNLTKQIASLLKKVSTEDALPELGRKLDEANMQALLINGWYNRFADELRIDQRRMKLNVLLQKTLTLNAIIHSIEAHILRKLKESMKYKEIFPQHVRDYYANLRDDYNLFLSKYKDFLKKAQSQVGVIGAGYFEHLE